ncbi:hypothetical protein CD178_03124 (plasmid) [Komagataeibacter saccharivorans]|uniref:Uncharacterized protein n=1 Tax=Komagataeibacter saccharivorans TaxID=265959 RepID=A0A347WG75_9PROT|nr:hypothetical protein CD178_03124 [Komagataeibacter saccharivorans]
MGSRGVSVCRKGILRNLLEKRFPKNFFLITGHQMEVMLLLMSNDYILS